MDMQWAKIVYQLRKYQFELNFKGNNDRYFQELIQFGPTGSMF